MADYDALDALLGDEPAAQEADDKADVPASDDTPAEETPNGSEADQPTEETDEEESEETSDEDESEETTRTGPLSEVKKLREQRRTDREAFEKYKSEMDELLNDPQFLAHRANQLQQAKEEQAANPQPIEIPYAPAYPNTPRGADRMKAEQVEATRQLGNHAENQAVIEAIQGYVLQGKTYLEATRTVQDLFKLEASTFKTEGKREAEAVVAKKTRMSDATKPRSAPKTERDRLLADLKSKSETTRMQAGIEILGL